MKEAKYVRFLIGSRAIEKKRKRKNNLRMNEDQLSSKGKKIRFFLFSFVQ